LDSYILDFYCPAAKLAIELDGGGHNYHVGQIRDRTRSESLARKGIIVLRFWNHQVRQELDSVLQAIWFALQERCSSKPSPNPLPSPFGKGRGELLVWCLHSTVQHVIDKWQNNSLIQRRISDEPNYNGTAGLSDLQETEIA
jgi:hypothetical protein